MNLRKIPQKLGKLLEISKFWKTWFTHKVQSPLRKPRAACSHATGHIPLRLQNTLVGFAISKQHERRRVVPCAFAAQPLLASIIAYWSNVTESDPNPNPSRVVPCAFASKPLFVSIIAYWSACSDRRLTAQSINPNPSMTANHHSQRAWLMCITQYRDVTT